MFSIDTMSEDWKNVIPRSTKSFRTDYHSCYGVHCETHSVLRELAESSHFRRYAGQAEMGSFFCERNRRTSTVEFASGSNHPLSNTLESHVKHRIQHENRGLGDVRGTSGGDTERRLSDLELN